MEKTRCILWGYDEEEMGYVISDTNSDSNTIEVFKVDEHDYVELKKLISVSKLITEHGKKELFEDWEYVTNTKIERNGGYFFSM